MENEKFGRLTVKCKTSERICNRVVWLCICNCGKSVKATTTDLRRKKGGKKSCGCLLYDKITEYGRGLIDIVGKRYGNLLVIENSGQRKRNRILWKCKCNCGIEKLLLKSSLESGLVVSCGCHKASIAKNRAGDKHWNWKGGITDAHVKDRNCQNYINWRKAVFSRDGFKCIECKVTGVLNAHHLDCFSKYPELRFVIENGVTLCKQCHCNFHKVYGKENNTKFQFEEFQLKNSCIK
jgi:hypothetical protein